MRIERERLGLTQSALAERIGLSRKSQVNYEVGTREPDAGYLARLGELGADINFIVTGVPAAAGVAQRQPASPLDHFGPRLREVRGDRTAAAFAADVGLSAQQAAALEANEERPTYDAFNRLVTAHPEHSPGYLAGTSPAVSVQQFSELEAILVHNYRAASAEGKESIRRLAAFSADYALKQRT